MPNAGFLVFKDGLHQEIGNKWGEYVQTDLEYQHNVNHKEQYALALAVGGKESEQMTSSEHVMLWNDEFPTNGIVYYAGKALEPDIDTLPNTSKGKIFVMLKSILKE